MKIRSILLPLFAISSLAIGACGQYTNFPAQYHIAGTSSLVATVAYPSNSSGTTGTTSSSAVVKLPKLVIKGEPGSVGVNFNQMDIKYNVADISATTLPISMRVDSSNFRDTNGTVIAESASYDLPVISPKVLDYGKRQGIGNISAIVTLSGSDDAAWPVSIDVNVPIVFLPSASGS